ncbi:hypothetical protein J437_LFUL001285 [Ladona fulva]|uniref:Anaphase-promoting complex subunit 5 n=1 Tax=Ladona fulva TaxID=123851 RepID=A0A8K0JXS8_LADFU|nr:hypothetical protein J437_LFUL001285 [Ladona fulva]
MAASKETVSFGVVQKKSVKENITPHKIAVVLLILEYCHMKKKSTMLTKKMTFDPRSRIDFCMLMLKLIQCPDIDLEELLSLLKSGKYSIVPAHIENFEAELMDLYRKGVIGLMDIAQNIFHIFMEQPHHLPVLINKSSIIGLYLRRINVCMSKLSFAQVVRAYQNFKIYYEKAQRRGDVDKVVKKSPKVEPDMSITGCSDISLEIDPMEEQEKQELWHDVDVGCWSRRQAELFIAQQAGLIETDEGSALPPPVLQERMHDLLKANPKCAEAHYLCYLNCMRVREFCGAVHSLHHCFDRSTVVADSKGITQDEKNKGFRYAALNLAALHAQFGHKKQARNVLQEAIKIAHEANDNVCLQHALTWLYKLADSNKKLLIQRSISKSNDLGLMYLASLGMQSLAQYNGLNGKKPSAVFELLTESDGLNCQHSLGELTASSYAQKAALWNLYGKTEMASLSSQLLLLLNTKDDTPGSPGNNTEGSCLALCNVANYFIHHGEYQLAQVVLQQAMDRFPRGPLSARWMLSEQLLGFTHALYTCQWHEAEQAAKCMAPLDPWESKLRKIELYVAKGENPHAHALAEKVLALCQRWSEKDTPQVPLDPSPKELDVEKLRDFCGKSSEIHVEPKLPQPLPSVQVRALILLAEANLEINSRAAVTYLTSALSFAYRYHLEYLSAIAGVVMADLQLKMGLPSQALGLLEQCLPVILSHGSCYERGRAMFLLVRCKLAASTPPSPPSNASMSIEDGLDERNSSSDTESRYRKDLLEECIKVLEGVKANFEKLEAIAQLKDVLLVLKMDWMVEG